MHIPYANAHVTAWRNAQHDDHVVVFQWERYSMTQSTPADDFAEDRLPQLWATDLDVESFTEQQAAAYPFEHIYAWKEAQHDDHVTAWAYDEACRLYPENFKSDPCLACTSVTPDACCGSCDRFLNNEHTWVSLVPPPSDDEFEDMPF